MSNSKKVELIDRNLKTIDIIDMSDLLMVMARNVEDSLIQSGAKAGKDYTYLDLYKLASPYALAVFNKGKTKHTIRLEIDGVDFEN